MKTHSKEWYEENEPELAAFSLEMENLCDCNNNESQFYQNHGCCEACFYGIE